MIGDSWSVFERTSGKSGGVNVGTFVEPVIFWKKGHNAKL